VTDHKQGLRLQNNVLSGAEETFLTESQKQLAVQMHLTALNAKLEPESELAQEFARVFGAEPAEAIEWVFQEWRLQSPFFPAIADIVRLISRWHGKAESDDEKKVEADAAWTYVNDYLRKWGVDMLPIYSGGKQVTPPPLDPRAEFALRRIGGFQALNQMDVSRMPFIYRDFCEAYTLAPLAESMAPRLREQLGSDKLLGKVTELANSKKLDSHKDKRPLP